MLTNAALAELLASAAALEAGISADRIVNFMPLDELKRWAAELRS